MSRKKSKGRKRRNHRRDITRRRDRLARFQHFTFEIYDEPVEVNRTQEVRELAETAFDLLSRNDGAGAERLLKQALNLDPEACDLRNNLGAAYEVQGRREEAETLVREIHAQNPDYFFGRANLAHLCIKDGDLERAAELVGPLLKRRRMHVTEFSSLAGAQIHLCLASGDVDAARGWLRIWMEVAPGHPAQEQWRRSLALTPLGWLRRVAMRREQDAKRIGTG